MSSAVLHATLSMTLAMSVAGCDVVFDLNRPPAALDAPLEIDAPPALDCPASFVELAGSHYERIPVSATWLAGELACEAKRGNATGYTHLAVIGSDLELTTVLMSFPGVPLALGFTDGAVEGSFVPITDEVTAWPPSTTPPWLGGQPNNLNEQDCLHVDATGQLDDKDCDDPGDTFQALCECDSHPVAPF